MSSRYSRLDACVLLTKCKVPFYPSPFLVIIGILTRIMSGLLCGTKLARLLL